MPAARPLALALALGLISSLAAHDVQAQRKRAAPKPPPVSPACTDYYATANAHWLQTHPVSVDAPAVSALGQLVEQVQAQQRALLDDAMQSPQNDVQRLLGDFWASGLDEAAVERDGVNPIAPLLGRINGIKRARDIPPAIAALHQVGIPVLFNFGADVDLENLGRHIGYFMQGGLGLPDPAYYTRTDDDTRQLLGRYRSYVQQILTLTGTPADQLESQSQAVLDLEARIAQVSKPLSELRNPFANYAPVPVADLRKRYRNLQLDAFLKVQGVNDDLVSMADAELFTRLDQLVTGLKPDQWKTYLRWRVGDAMAPYLAQAFRNAEFEFRGRVLRGDAAPSPRWQQVLAAINTAAGPMLGREYVARHLTPERKAQAEWIAGGVRDQLAQALQREGWMDAASRAEARAKLDRMKIEVGAPRRDLDYTVQPMGRGSFGSNMLIASTWHHREEMKRIGKHNADRRWDVLPQQVALAYDIAHNRLIVTAAVLQPPVFDPAQGEASLYGAFGALVGHELTGLFDVKGRHVDSKGKLRDWWTPADQQAWQALSAQLAAQYERYDFPQVSGVKVSGRLTGEENLADLSGLELAYAAFTAQQAEASAENRQAFFHAWAGLWPQQLSPVEASRRVTADVRAPGQWRTNGPLVNLAAFAQAFDCKAGQPMQRAEAEQVVVWR